LTIAFGLIPDPAFQFKYAFTSIEAKLSGLHDVVFTPQLVHRRVADGDFGLSTITEARPLRHRNLNSAVLGGKSCNRFVWNE